jgi:hypothetical protein
MSVSAGSAININGLVFAYDVKNINSYRGPAMQNLLTALSPQGQGNTTYYKFSSGTEQVYIPTLGPVNCSYMDMYNDYNGGSGNCCPSPYGYGTGIPVTGSTLYTYAILYKSVNRYTHPNYMYHYEYGPSGYITEYGVHMVSGYSGQETQLGDDWYWSRSKFTTNASATSINTGSWMYEYARYNRLYVAKVMITPGDYTALHPRYWPSIATTRANTQTIFDQIGGNIVTVNSLTYGTDGTPSFNGSSDYITVGALSGSISQFTVSVWFYSTSVSNYRNPIDCNFSYNGTTGNIGPRLEQNSSGNLGWIVSGNTSSNNTFDTFVVKSSGLQANTWYNTVITWTNGSANTYLNGVPVTVNASTPNGFVNVFNNVVIGKGFHLDAASVRSFTGQIPAVQIYNKVLSAAEIAQNFAASRKYYGL